jgi:hypothetical protein
MAAEENPFQVGEAERNYNTANSVRATLERAKELGTGPAAQAKVVDWGLNQHGPGKGGIGKSVPRRNFKDVKLQPPTWFSDKEHKKCQCCDVVFSFRIRKHHCRFGRISRIYKGLKANAPTPPKHPSPRCSGFKKYLNL